MEPLLVLPLAASRRPERRRQALMVLVLLVLPSRRRSGRPSSADALLWLKKRDDELTVGRGGDGGVVGLVGPSPVFPVGRPCSRSPGPSPSPPLPFVFLAAARKEEQSERPSDAATRSRHLGRRPPTGTPSHEQPRPRGIYITCARM